MTLKDYVIRDNYVEQVESKIKNKKLRIKIYEEAIKTFVSTSEERIQTLNNNGIDITEKYMRDIAKKLTGNPEDFIGALINLYNFHYRFTPKKEGVDTLRGELKSR